MSYVPFEPGAAVQVEPIMRMQEMIKEDIRNQIEAAKKELRCPKRRFLRLDDIQSAVLTHNLGCHPFIQVFELEALPIQDAPEKRSPDTEPVFCFCAPIEHRDPNATNFVTKGADKTHWGIDITEFVKQFSDDDQQNYFKKSHSVGAWIAKLLMLLFEPGAAFHHFSEKDVFTTAWVDARIGMTVADLEAKGEFPVRFVYRPRLVTDFIGAYGGEQPSASSAPKKASGSADGTRVNIYHLNLNEVEIKLEKAGPATPVRLMVLLGP